MASTPHPAAVRSSYNEGGSDQHERSGYMRAFREAPRGELETAMLADEAAGLRAVYADLPPESVEEHVRVLSQPGALVAALAWYRAMSGAPSAAHPAASVPPLHLGCNPCPPRRGERGHTGG